MKPMNEPKRNDETTPPVGTRDGATTATVDEPAQRVAELEQEIASLKDRNLRLVAEMQNLQRRGQREKEEALKFAESEFAKQLLVVLDGLERAQDAARDAANTTALADGDRKSV